MLFTKLHNGIEILFEEIDTDKQKAIIKNGVELLRNLVRLDEE